MRTAVSNMTGKTGVGGRLHEGARPTSSSPGAISQLSDRADEPHRAIDTELHKGTNQKQNRYNIRLKLTTCQLTRGSFPMGGFYDLDGTLLDRDTYSGRPPRPP